MAFTWYKIFNKTEFDAEGLVSKEYEVIFENIGLKTILVTQGNRLSVLIDDVFLSINLNDKNPFSFESRAVYLDDNNDVWVGIEVD
jgi:hypothetical protein